MSYKIIKIDPYLAPFENDINLRMNAYKKKRSQIIKKGEKLRIDISSSAFPHYLPHTNCRGLFSEQARARVATNTVNLEQSYLELPISAE